MPKKYVTIMDIASSKITVFVGMLGVNNTFFIRGQGESDYAGFLDGEFLESDKLELAMGMAISNAEASSGLKIDSLYIGAPAEFSFVECVESENKYNKKRTINDNETSKLKSRVIDENIIKNKTLISCTPIWYMLDDNRKITNIPYKIKSSRIKAKLSMVYIENKFIKLVNSALSKLKIRSVEYISTPLAESRYLLNKTERDKKAIIIDVDYISTSVIEVWGKGLTALKTFSLGGGHITADLSEAFDISFNSAEKLKNDIILSVSSKRTDCYEVFTKDKTLPVPINIANEVVLYKIKAMASIIDQCLHKNKEENLEINAVYLTGSGLSYINGAREYLAKYLGMNVDLLNPSMPSMAKPHFSSSLSVLYVALKDKNDGKLSWLKRILKI